MVIAFVLFAVHNGVMLSPNDVRSKALHFEIASPFVGIVPRCPNGFGHRRQALFRRTHSKPGCDDRQAAENSQQPAESFARNCRSEEAELRQ